MDEFLGVNLTSAIEYFKVAVYFSAFFGVIYACVNRTIQSRNSVKAWLLTVNGVVALTIAWFFIGSWFIQEFQASSKSSSSSSIISLNDVLRWVEGADLFERAYVLVTFDVRGWIWSQQLLFLSITVSVIMWSEGSMRVSRGPGQERLTMSVGQGGKRVNNKNGNGTTFLSAWIFLILGFLGAMSAGFSLFLSHMTFVPRLGLRHAQPLRLPWWVTSCIILSTLSVAISPFIVSSDGGVFGANLLALHFLLLAPPLLASNFRTSQTPRPFIPDGRMEVIYATATRVSSLYAFLTGTFLISHMFQMAQLVTSTLATTATETQSASQVLELILSQLWTGIWINHCQTSITMDYFFGSIAALIYMISEGVVKRNRISITTTLLLFTPFLSAAFTLPLFMSLREGWKIEENVIDIIEEKKKY